MTNLKALPHTKLVIQFIGTAAVTLVPRFKGGIIAPFKRVRHFYGTENLVDFYTPNADLSALRDADDAYLVYGLGVDESEYPAMLDYPGLSGPQEDFFDMDTDSIKLAADKVKWAVDMPLVEPYAGRDVLPYVIGSAGLTKLAVGTLDTGVVPLDGSPLVYDVGVERTFILKFTKASSSAAFAIDLYDEKIADKTDVDILLAANSSAVLELFEPVAGFFGAATCKLTYDADTKKLTIKFGIALTVMTAVTAMSLDAKTVVPYPDDATVDGRWFYTALNKESVITATLLSVMRGIQGYGTVVAGDSEEDSDGNFHSFIEVEESEDYDDVWDMGSKTIGVSFQDLVKSAEDVDKLQVFKPFYSFTTTSFYDVDPSGVPGDLKLSISALTTLLTEENDVTEDTMFVGNAHIGYIADFAKSSTGNRYANAIYRSDAAVGVFPLVDGAYTWGLPHPDNPMGFAAYIAGTILSADNYYYVTLSDDKSKGFSLLGKEIPKALFFANLWEEYGQGGLSEDSFLATQEEKYDNYPNVYTYMAMNPRIDKRGTSEEYNVYPGTVVEGEYYINKASGDINFTGAPAVTIGDYVEMLFASGDAQRMVVTGVESDRLRLSKKVSATGEVAFRVYTRMTSATAKSYYDSKFASTKFNLFCSLNTNVAWGSHFISTKWLSLTAMLRRLVYPEQQPLTKVSVDIGLFGKAYGGYEFFEIGDLDHLVSRGFMVHVTDPDSATSYIVRDVSAGLKSDDYRRGNGNAVTPITTFAAACRTILDKLVGKYNKNDYVREQVKLRIEAVQKLYTKTPPIPDYGPKLRIARLKEVNAITGGYEIILEVSPNEQCNVFDIKIRVIKNEED